MVVQVAFSDYAGEATSPVSFSTINSHLMKISESFAAITHKKGR